MDSSLFGDFPMSLPKTIDEFFLPDPIEIIKSNEYPDVVKDLTSKQNKQIVECLITLNNPSLVNKKGIKGGFTVLHW